MTTQKTFLRNSIVVRPFLVIADTTESDCRSERKTEEFARIVKWDYPKFIEYKRFTEDPLISIIMVTDNDGEYAATAIKSLLSQTHSNFELIVFDNASTDNTSLVVSQVADPRVKRFSSTIKMPVPVYLNMGILVARGEAFSFHSTLYLSAANRYEKQITALRDNASKNGEGLSTVANHLGAQSLESPLIAKRVQMDVGYLENTWEGSLYEYTMKIRRLTFPYASVTEQLYTPNSLLQDRLAAGESMARHGEIDVYHDWFVKQSTTTYRAFPPKEQHETDGNFVVDVDVVWDILH